MLVLPTYDAGEKAHKASYQGKNKPLDHSFLKELENNYLYAILS